MRKVLLCCKKIAVVLIILLCSKLIWELNMFPANTHSSTIPSESIQEKIKANYKPDQTKFLIYSCSKDCKDLDCFKVQEISTSICGGLGDRFKGISAAFLWSILTKRTFLIQITEPCLLQESLEPNIISWQNGLDQLIEKVNKRQITSVRVEFKANSMKHKIIENNVYQSDKDMKKLNFLTYMAHYDAILFRSNMDISSYLFKNRIHEKRINELGLSRQQITLASSFNTIYQMLFKLKPRLQSQFDAFIKSAKPDPKAKLICAQIRLGGLRNYSDPIRMSPKQVKQIWTFIKQNFSSATSGHKIFVTSDNSKIVEQAKSIFGTNNVVTTHGIITHIDQKRNISKTKDANQCDVYDKTFLDFHLLGRGCDMAVVSRSGFGRLGVYNRNSSFSNIFIYKKVNEKYMFESVF
jgi:hypothetical protein